MPKKSRAGIFSGWEKVPTSRSRVYLSLILKCTQQYSRNNKLSTLIEYLGKIGFKLIRRLEVFGSNIRYDKVSVDLSFYFRYCEEYVIIYEF